MKGYSAKNFPLRVPSWFFRVGGIGCLISCGIGGGAQRLPPEISSNDGHCAVMQGTPDNQLFACQVWNRNPRLFAAPAQIEIYNQSGKVATIATGKPILEWHFWGDGKQLSVHYGTRNAPDAYVLYDAATATEISTISDSAQSDRLPQWAKSRVQVEDESVPESVELKQQRTAWIAKVLRQLGTIHPGMTRKDLSSVLKTEGGMSTRFQRTYVSRECPYIKMTLRFKAAEGDTDAINEKPEDIVISVSGPYLGWSILD